jgi:hypothetical protein
MLVPVLVIPVVSVWPYAVELMRMTVYGSSLRHVPSKKSDICNEGGMFHFRGMIDEARLNHKNILISIADLNQYYDLS